MTLQPRNGRRSPKLPTRSRNDQKSEIFPLQTSGVLRDLDANANILRGVRVPVVSLDQKEFQKDDINSPSDRKKDGTNIKQKKPKIYYKTSWEREVVKEALKAAGMVRAKKKKTLAHLYWTKHLSRKQIAALKEGQMTNHFPESWCIGRKDRLITCFEKAGKQNRKGMYDEFLPKSFLLPRDFDKYKKAARSRKNMYIMKPVASSCGRGIKLISKKDKIDRQKKCVIQEYIKSPYLIGLKKFDLRLYCLVSSFDPLRAYLYREGIVRFASKPYSPKTKASKYSYLTNFSVNQKILPNETEDHKYDEIKWTLSRFWEYIVDTEGREKQEKCEKQIKDIMIKTLIAADAEITPALRSSTRSRRCCFELFGFDILLDSALKPWILEVNISPSLGIKTDVDKQVKFPLISDMFNLIGIRKPRPREGNDAHNGVANVSMDDEQEKEGESSNHNGLSSGEHECLVHYNSEISRKGNFECLYPCASSCNHYFELFQEKTNRRNDFIMAKVIGAAK